MTSHLGPGNLGCDRREVSTWANYLHVTSLDGNTESAARKETPNNSEKMEADI